MGDGVGRRERTGVLQAQFSQREHVETTEVITNEDTAHLWHIVESSHTHRGCGSEERKASTYDKQPTLLVNNNLQSSYKAQSLLD